MSILKEGFPFIIPSFAASLALKAASVFAPLPLSIVCIALGALLFFFSVFCLFFFRDPKIEITQGENIILCPCNGTVMEVTEEDGQKVVRVFLSIFNVHLQRSPVSGTVTSVVHKKGKFFAAWNPRAQAENEQNIITIQGADIAGLFVVRQIAGFVARRCVSWVKTGDVLKAGDKIGMIKFSSQVDLHLPAEAKIMVKPGDHTQAGITIMAEK